MKKNKRKNKEKEQGINLALPLYKDLFMRPFKEMRFECIAMPEFKSEGTVYRSVARFRRTLGANDRLIEK